MPTGWTSERHSTLAATIYRNREGRHPQSVWVPDDQRRMIDIIGSQRLTFDEAHSLAWLLIMGTPATE